MAMATLYYAPFDVGAASTVRAVGIAVGNPDLQQPMLHASSVLGCDIPQVAVEGALEVPELSLLDDGILLFASAAYAVPVARERREA
ncbi:MAG: hypothetical protein AAB582_03480 [Patescibacteria group bacterium]